MPRRNWWPRRPGAGAADLRHRPGSSSVSAMMHSPTPAATRNTRSYPAASVTVGESSACVVAVALAIVASTARPIEPPTCVAVFAMPPMVPAEPAGALAVVMAISVGKINPMPAATSRVGPTTPLRYELSTSAWASQKKPATRLLLPASRSRCAPARGSAADADRATRRNIRAAGVCPSPARSAVYPRTSCRNSDEKYHIAMARAPNRSSMTLPRATAGKPNRCRGMIG